MERLKLELIRKIQKQSGEIKRLVADFCNKNDSEEEDCWLDNLLGCCMDFEAAANSAEHDLALEIHKKIFSGK